MNQSNCLLIHNLGFPRIGAKRELKKALEAFWAGRLSEPELQTATAQIRARNWQLQKAAGVDLIPSNDFSLYDHVLDTAVMVGAIPSRFHSTGKVDLQNYFAMARGQHRECAGCSPAFAMEMTKWFDTNYHYIVPELAPEQQFKLCSTKAVDEFNEAKALGIITMPVLLGPLTFLSLAKGAANSEQKSFDPLQLLDRLLPVYEKVLSQLSAAGAEWIQLDEPILVAEKPEGMAEALRRTTTRLRAAAGRAHLMLAVYFGPLREHLEAMRDLPVDALHVDAVRADEEVPMVIQCLPDRAALSLGVVDGRNVWKSDFDGKLRVIRQAQPLIEQGRLFLSPSCSLLHVPVGLQYETKLNPEIRNWLAFAEEKLQELKDLRNLVAGTADQAGWRENRVAIASRKQSPRVHSAAVQARAEMLGNGSTFRATPFEQRQKKQQSRLALPFFPTTTIGSFPQSEAVRSARARFKKGDLSPADYDEFLRRQIVDCVRQQEEIGLDVLVHGEFERNDMVEYFGEQLAGFAFTENGWVQSYGSRCVKPPILFGDVSRPHPMTVDWSVFAQSVTRKPMKAMLTGPVTILQWSFVRDDQPRSTTARQIAIAIRDEVLDLEKAGLAVIQIDEPALREGLPLRRDQWPSYLAWATECFRLCASGVQDETQIHTHMCYCEFDDILPSIAALDADVISIETSRSKMQLLRAFGEFQYPNAIGPGVWDIHSPRIPSADEMHGLIQAAAQVIDPRRLWVNPDCGLKTRKGEEVTPALKNLVAAARSARERFNINKPTTH